MSHTDVDASLYRFDVVTTSKQRRFNVVCRLRLVMFVKFKHNLEVFCRKNQLLTL